MGGNPACDYPGAVEIATHWAEYNGCVGELKLGDKPKYDLNTAVDGKETTVNKFQQCPNGIDVELWTLEGVPAPCSCVPRRPEREHRDLRWHPQAQGESKRAQTRIDIQESVCLRACPRLFAGGRRCEAVWEAIQARHKRREEPGRTPLAVAERKA